MAKSKRKMKDVQVIDSAENCFYPIYQFKDDEFYKVFPEPGQGVEFIEDAIERLGEEALGNVLENVWSRLIQKPEVNGIHGTLFYELLKKKKYYPGKKENLS